MYKKLHKPHKFNDFKEIVYRGAEVFSSKVAFCLENKNITYKELKIQFCNLCSQMLDLGLLGKRIAVIGKNSYEWALHYLSAATVGTVVPIDKELSVEDISSFIKSADCSAVFADSAIAEKLEAVFPEIHIADLKEEIKSYDDFKRVDDIEVDRENMTILIFTSGTTNSSKGVCLSQKNICENIYSTCQMVKATSKDRTLSILPLHHTYECTLNFLLMLSRGACISYATSLSKIKTDIEKASPTFLIVVPAILKVLNKRISSTLKKSAPKMIKPLFEQYPIHEALSKTPFLLRAIIRKKVKAQLGGKIHTFIVGAASLEPEYVKNFTALGIRTLQGYGLTECSPLLAGNSDFYFNDQSTGIAIPGVELKIDEPNEDGEGEILARGKNIMLGYFNDEEATKNVFKDGWFKTGDLGKMDPDGALYIIGRVKNVIVTSNGKNIYPEELEERLQLDDFVKECIVFGYNDNGNTKVKAKIYNDSDISLEEKTAKAKEIIKNLNATLPKYKYIDLFDVIEVPLEKTTTQKAKRYGINVQ